LLREPRLHRGDQLDAACVTADHDDLGELPLGHGEHAREDGSQRRQNSSIGFTGLMMLVAAGGANATLPTGTLSLSRATRRGVEPMLIGTRS